MNYVQNYIKRQQGLAIDLSYDFALKRLCVAKEDSWRGIQPSNYSSDFNPEPPIFAAKFANCDGYRHMLAIANEDGKIALQDTTQRNYEPEEKALTAPQCHYNAVFDLEWSPGQMRFISASGDHTARLWEVTNSEILAVRHFVGHTRSVKTAAFRKNDSSVFATGGRDGAIIIWDTRANLNVDMTPRADNCIYSGHVGGPGTPVSQRKRSRTPKMPPNTTSSSITGLAFQDENTLISCGAGDGIIKVWDLRRNYSTYKKEPHPKHSLPYAGSSTFKGFTNLIVDDAGCRLYANCMDNTIYCYNLNSYSPKPLARYRGLLNSTFYIKSCLSPDGRYLLSGSSDEKAYIWNLKYPDEPLVGLSGHTVEVTCVAWGSTHDRPIVTCSDDARHKIWRIGPENVSSGDMQENYRGNAQFVMKFTKPSNPAASTHKYNLRDLESTPRSLKRLVEQNERTPNTVEKVATKRSFLEMLGAAATNDAEGADVDGEGQEIKRQKTLETRGRRLFSPCPSNANNAVASTSLGLSVRCLHKQLASIPEEHNSSGISNALDHHDAASNNDSNQENAQQLSAIMHTPPSSIGISKIFPSINTTPSPLAERRPPVLDMNLNAAAYTSPPSTSLQATLATQTQQVPSMIYSPTSNLPNYVLDGEAPHLGIMSPKRKLKDKVDWLTKMRKQKLLSSCRGTTLAEKIQDSVHTAQGQEANAGGGGPVTAVASPRLQSLRQSESSPRSTTPKRRLSQNHHHMSPSSSSSPHQPRTPTSSRRNSETTLLRFFSVQATSSISRQDAPCTATALATADVGEMRPLSPGPTAATQLVENNVPSPTVTSNPAATTSLPAATTATCSE
ncbi:protein lethal(2)denticleless isoform X1 [Stomoxys calcitrans]|uniref:protein lethal(2)denticleless isoform X1 n=1 Tax=Stomoxys calcitrans TaxID=35570 RepID=UPI0027E37DDA|nr:protein lethal(2)denticleless isoform X1 [Stomoxys calcitrans]